VPIKQIVAGGPAERAGLRVGDRIRAVNGQQLHTARASSEPSSLAQVIADRAGGLALMLAC